MEEAECPVCLQVFTSDTTIPRVLACGHSVCESCLLHLPPSFPDTLRCPVCTQLLPFPKHPRFLPKNIDLIRLSSQTPNPNPIPKPIPKHIDHEFLPGLWSREFYHKWAGFIISKDSVSKNGKVGLFKVGVFKDDYDDGDECSRFEFGYVAKVMLVLFKMRSHLLDEVEFILRSSLNENRICQGYGLWFNEEDLCLYLVFQRMDCGLLDVSGCDLSSFGVIGMELCETISRLGDAGLVIGCSSLSCFGVDDFGHVFVDLYEVLMVGMRVQKMITEAVLFARNNDGKRLDMETIDAFPSPEVIIEFLKKEGAELEFDKSICEVGYNSDVWSLACVLLSFLVGKSFVEETHDFVCSYILTLINGNVCDCEGLYVDWSGKVSVLLDTSLGSDHVLMELLHKCLSLDPVARPHVNDLWKCVRSLIIKPKFDVIGSKEHKTINRSTCHCVLLGDLLWSPKKTNKVDDKNDVTDIKEKTLVVEGDVIEGLRKNSLTCTELKGHLDCISGLVIGGDFLFSSSFDKTIKVWSLQGFNHVHTFKGHEHKVMAVLFVDSESPVCISADNGGDIFIWGTKLPFEEKPIKRLNEEKDWRYSGIHALAVSQSGSGYFYTGSGDKTIKAWSMHDYSLSSTMSGHKSVVSALAVCSEVLYSGSWDGTIRLWCLSDHSPLAVLGEEAPTGGSVLSLAAHTSTIVAGHENGCIKVSNILTLTNSLSMISGIFWELQEKLVF
ncbi:zinc ion binding protein [Artemisia annua]|uniref:Zinc ion binding protein n=1 Tax=Artemisia annua TaxID=35608 RepID=A0A2U1PGJ4_ARTAN|nr:zinc ion binding protein [Artemisia annua]